jgi:cephalosporin hydroxylase
MAVVRHSMNRIRSFLLTGRSRWLAMRNASLKHAFAVPSHLTNQERVVLYDKSRSAAHVAEIGSYIGASACCFGAAARERGNTKIVCIDTWNNEGMAEGLRDTWKEFKANTEQYSRFIVPVRGFSTDVGDHSYQGVKADWEAYRSLLKAGSTVVFHDYGWAEGVQRVVHENVLPLVRTHDHLPNMWWGTFEAAP